MYDRNVINNLHAVISMSSELNVSHDKNDVQEKRDKKLFALKVIFTTGACFFFAMLALPAVLHEPSVFSSSFFAFCLTLTLLGVIITIDLFIEDAVERICKSIEE